MANIAAADVKKLRDLTAAGMMECKKALEEADGDFDKAVEILRISGAAKAAKRGAERTASNGLVANDGNVLVELLCETDFVAKNADFQALADSIAATANAGQIGDAEALKSAKLDNGSTVDESIASMAGVIGEKLELGRVAVLPAPVAVYMHKRASDLPPQVGTPVMKRPRGASRCRSRRCVRRTSLVMKFPPMSWKTSAESLRPPRRKRASPRPPYQRSWKAV